MRNILKIKYHLWHGASVDVGKDFFIYLIIKMLFHAAILLFFFGVKILRFTDALFVHHQEHYSIVAAATGVFHE